MLGIIVNIVFKKAIFHLLESREKDIFYPLLYFPSVFDRRDRVRQKPGDRNLSYRSLSTGAIICCLPGSLAR